MSILEHTFNRVIPAIAKLHDTAIKVVGQDVIIIVPDMEDLDLYGTRTADTTDEFQTQMVIDWSSYRMMVDTTVSNIEIETDDIPLVALAKVGDTIPVGSIIKMDVIHPAGNVEQQQFKVAKNDVLATTQVYGRQLSLLPYRGDNY